MQCLYLDFFSVLELECQPITMDHYAVNHVQPEPFIEMIQRLVQLTVECYHKNRVSQCKEIW